MANNIPKEMENFQQLLFNMMSVQVEVRKAAEGKYLAMKNKTKVARLQYFADDDFSELDENYKRTAILATILLDGIRKEFIHGVYPKVPVEESTVLGRRMGLYENHIKLSQLYSDIETSTTSGLIEYRLFNKISGIGNKNTCANKKLNQFLNIIKEKGIITQNSCLFKYILSNFEQLSQQLFRIQDELEMIFDRVLLINIHREGFHQMRSKLSVLSTCSTLIVQQITRNDDKCSRMLLTSITKAMQVINAMVLNLRDDMYSATRQTAMETLPIIMERLKEENSQLFLKMHPTILAYMLDTVKKQLSNPIVTN